MSTIKYTQDHQWLRLEADGTVTLGITTYAQEQLGDIVFIELPAVGSRIDTEAKLIAIESVKAVGEVQLAFAGTVVAINTALADAPELVNSAPEDAGWLVRLSLDDVLVLDGMLDGAGYQAHLATL